MTGELPPNVTTVYIIYDGAGVHDSLNLLISPDGMRVATFASAEPAHARPGP